jgi:hypothetical protein
MYAGLYTGGSDDPEVLAGNGQPFLSANQAIALRTVVNGRNASITSRPGPGGALDVAHRLETLLGRDRPAELARREPMSAPGTVEVILP